MAAIIEVQGIRKDYVSLFGRRQAALTGVDLAIPAGTSFGLIGANGAGKTTFIKLLLGIVRPSSGRASVLGAAPGDVGARQRIGYLPERLQLPGSWSAVAFLQSVARLRRTDASETAALSALERVGLAREAKRRVGTYSKGMRQRLGLASALLGQPALLILDEPTDGIDPMGRADVRRILAEEKARGATLFLNSHLLSETERVCDRVAVLAAGKVIREGPVEELCRQQAGWKARWAGDPAPLRAMGLEALSDGWWHLPAGDPSELNRVLRQAQEAGALLVELRPGRDLEGVLVDAVREVA